MHIIYTVNLRIVFNLAKWILCLCLFVGSNGNGSPRPLSLGHCATDPPGTKPPGHEGAATVLANG